MSRIPHDTHALVVERRCFSGLPLVEDFRIVLIHEAIGQSDTKGAPVLEFACQKVVTKRCSPLLWVLILVGDARQRDSNRLAAYYGGGEKEHALAGATNLNGLAGVEKFRPDFLHGGVNGDDVPTVPEIGKLRTDCRVALAQDALTHVGMNAVAPDHRVRGVNGAISKVQ